MTYCGRSGSSHWTHFLGKTAHPIAPAALPVLTAPQSASPSHSDSQLPSANLHLDVRKASHIQLVQSSTYLTTKSEHPSQFFVQMNGSCHLLLLLYSNFLTTHIQASSSSCSKSSMPHICFFVSMSINTALVLAPSHCLPPAWSFYTHFFPPQMATTTVF